ncbi:MAG: response regulator transcription factor [Clostridia bacterium]|nr:response regulator transcription factor [Clostridia bacterium]
MKTILVAEDESAIREFIVINLSHSGYNIIEAADGAEAVRLYDEHASEIDLCLLDIMMPEMDGIEVCKEIRKRSSTVGVIILTAKTEEMDKVTGLLVGADDYVTKPFSPAELLARVDALYRRVEMVSHVREEPSSKISLSEFTLDIRSRTLTKNGAPIELTQVEFQIMEYFFNNPGAALSRTDILHQVWGDSYFGEEKIVDVNIRRLRMKVEDNPSAPKHLMTIWGIGYKWVR